MQLWHILILANIVLMTTGIYLGKFLIHRIHAYQILFYQYIASLCTISLYILILRPESRFTDVPIWFVLIGFMYAIGISSSYRAKKQSLSKTSVLSNAENIIAIGLAVVFLGEFQILSFTTTDGIMRSAGLALTALTVYLLYSKKTHKSAEKSFNFNIWAKWLAIAVLVLGVAKFIVKYAVDLHQPLLVLRLQYIGSFLVIAALMFYTKKSFNIGWKNAIICFIIGIFVSSGLASLYTSLSLSSATQVFPIATVARIMFVTLIGVFVFNEKFTKKLYLPFGLGIIAIYFLS